jgi:cytochrome o ubiquinol oxidase subunit 1
MGFMVMFTIGGVAGVLMAVPPIDFQLHNSLFLVAHFHMMIIGGVLFGYFAGITYWFPKIFGFRLNERLGKYAFGCWLTGFVLAFTPLYALGLMGATRRLDTYNKSLGWQWLFIVAGIGVIFVIVGIGFQILQFIVSFQQREQNRDLTGDPWKGRTLEWATSSPAQSYNFAVLPEVTTRDAFWTMKHRKHVEPPQYESIRLPRNTPAGLIIAAFAFLGGFGVVWHILWLVILGGFGILLTIIIRTSNEDSEYTVSAARIEKLENARKGQAV